MLHVLVDNPVVVLFAVLAAGTLLGAVRLGGIAAGPAGALFAGLALSAAVPQLAGVVPPLIGTLGLALFAYTVGLAGGPSFFSGFRHHAGLMGATVAVFVGLAAVALVVGRSVGLDAADISGVYAGAVTNTPGLAAAVEVTGSNRPVVGYSLAYPFGVLGMILAIVLATRWSERHPNAEELSPPPHASYSNVEVTRDDLPPLRDLASFGGTTLVFSRVRRGDSERTPEPDLRLEPGDLVTVIGPEDVLPEVADRLGRVTDRDLPLDRRQVDFRRVVLSNPRYAGETVADLELTRFDAIAGFVRRGDVDLVATPDLIVELGDRIRVVAPRERLPEVVRELGDSERAVVVADPIGFSLGLLFGLALGLVPIPLPGGAIALGSAAGPLLVGLILGRVGHAGPVSWQLPYATNQALRQFGMLLFLATVGLGAGPDLVEALRSAIGLQLLGMGALITTVAAIGLVVVARTMGLGSARLAGTIAGAQNQPAILSFAVDRTDGDDRVNLAYALLFPPTFVAKIICAQLLATWA
jgi:putative transport protein